MEQLSLALKYRFVLTNQILASVDVITARARRQNVEKENGQSVVSVNLKRGRQEIYKIDNVLRM